MKDESVTGESSAFVAFLAVAVDDVAEQEFSVPFD